MNRLERKYMRIIKKLSLLLASFLLLGAMLAPASALAVDPNTQAVCDGIALTGGSCGGAPAAGSPTVESNKCSELGGWRSLGGYDYHRRL